LLSPKLTDRNQVLQYFHRVQRIAMTALVDELAQSIDVFALWKCLRAKLRDPTQIKGLQPLMSRRV